MVFFAKKPKAIATHRIWYLCDDGLVQQQA